MALFQDVLVRKPGRSLFNLTHERKFSCDWSYIYPILCQEVVPGDTFKIKTEVLVRTAPLVSPVMHRVNVKVNYFYIPNRLLMEDWQDFITGINQKSTYNPASDDQSNYFVTKVPPYTQFQSSSSVREYLSDGSLADFLGFPTMRPGATPDVTSPINVQLLPFRAYQKVYNDWFRNQNVEGEQWSSLRSGMDQTQVPQTFSLRKRMWEKDYFTSALPFAQRGDPVKIPLANITYNKDGKTVLKDDEGNSFLPNSSASNQVMHASADGNDVVIDTKDGSGAVVKPVNIDNTSNLQVNMGTINDLRIATKLQRWLEVNARVGGRYIEQILGHYGVHSSDARLQRSEYLGGWSQPIIISDIEQNSATMGQSVQGSTTPQGNLAGKGTAFGFTKPVKCFCEEHGFILGVLSIIPRTAYQDGLPKMFQRNYKEDYYFPEFANLGEQDINKAELFFDLTSASNRTFKTST